MLRSLEVAALVGVLSGSGVLSGCGESAGPGPGPAPDAGDDAASPPPPDAGAAWDGGPFTVDPGPCETWTGVTPGAPITGLAPGTWTWVDVPEAHCMDGSPTGFGVSLSPGGTARLAIYLEGGGACFDPISCSGVANPDGFDGADFRSGVRFIENYDLFDRTSASSPIRDWSFIYVPYCTGDVHAGTNPDGYGGREQVGYTNMTRFLERIVATFPDLEVVLLAGASAGGLGALSNFDQVSRSFGCTPVHVVNDSGPVLADAYLRPCLQRLTRDLWRFPVPEDCPQCTGPDGANLVAMWGYLATKYRGRRLALLSTTGDQTMRNFYGFGLSPRCNFPTTMSTAMYEEGLLDLRDRVLVDYPNAATFYVRSEQHTFLTTRFESTRSGGLTVAGWLAQLLADDPAWTDVGPD